MQASFKAENPDTIEFTLTLTLPLSTWKKIADGFTKKYTWPETEITDAVNYMVKQAEREYHPE